MHTSRKAVTEDRDVEQAACELAQVEHSSGWERVVQVSEVIARHLAGSPGKSVDWRQRAESRSIRRLAAHPACPFSKTQLDDLLAAYEVYHCEPLARDIALSPSHAAAVARLPEHHRRSLLARAIDEHLSVRDLKLCARDIRRDDGERRGRPLTSAAGKAKTRLENAVFPLEEAVTFLTQAESLGELQKPIEHLIEEIAALVRQASAQVHFRHSTIVTSQPDVPVDIEEVQSIQQVG